MNYTSELKKFVTGQYIYFGLRMSLTILIPSLILAHFGVLKEYYLFPLGTSFVGGTDQPGPYIRRRNALILSVFCFVFVALVASLVKDYQFLVYGEIIIFGLFFSMIGLYGQRLGSVGAFALIVLAIFIDGHLTGTDILRNMLVFFAGCSWFVVVFLIVTHLQPYKLAGQMVGENYLELADFLKLKAGFYSKNPDFSKLFSQTISKQIKIKDLQEATRETVFKTREIVNEATTTSRLLMLMFLNSIDLHERLMTSENEYRKLQEIFAESTVLAGIHQYLLKLSDELTNIGIALQGGTKATIINDLSRELDAVYTEYFELRRREMNPHTLENFMVLRQILMRVSEITDEVKAIYGIFSQDTKFAKSLSTGLDFQRFVPEQEHLNFSVLKNNLSLKSTHFRHAVRLTLALVCGYIFSRFNFLGVGHSYWILITIIAIMKPAYSMTKSRNILRISGTISGGIFAYLLIYFIPNNTVLFFLLLASILLCYSLIRTKYFWAVFFMTCYILLSFNFLKPGNTNLIFRDRLADTAIGCAIATIISYLVLPVWEHTKTRSLMQQLLENNLAYFDTVVQSLRTKNTATELYRLRRKNAIISLANLSDNFQQMLSEPKNRQRKLQTLHQFVNTSHLITAYTASLAQFAKTPSEYPEIDLEGWQRKISAELSRTGQVIGHEENFQKTVLESRISPDDAVKELLEKRKAEIEEEEFYDRRDTTKISRLTELKNIREILKLIYNTAKEQRKVVEKYYATAQP